MLRVYARDAKLFADNASYGARRLPARSFDADRVA
jgi:hypothetical protein